MHIHTQRTTGSNRQWVSVNGVIGSSLQQSKNRVFSEWDCFAVPHPAALELIRRESYAWNTIKRQMYTSRNEHKEGGAFTHRCTHVASFQSHSSYGYWLQNHMHDPSEVCACDA